jgi:ribulose-phosphate 3-epimerase
MSVNPGFGGQKFIMNTYKKIRELKNMINDMNENCLIEVDGGISLNNISELCIAGADMFVAGASVFETNDKALAVKSLKEAVSHF